MTTASREAKAPMADARRSCARRLLSCTNAYLLIGGAIALAAATGALRSAEPAALLVVGIATLLALAVSVRVRRPSRVWPWASIGGSFVLFMAGRRPRARLQTLGDLTSDRSLVPDLLALPGYLLLAAGLLGFARRRIRDLTAGPAWCSTASSPRWRSPRSPGCSSSSPCSAHAACRSRSRW